MRFEASRRRGLTRRVVLRGALVVVLAATGVGTAVALSGPILKTTHNSRLGAIVVNAKGQTLYHLTGETSGQIKCTGECAAFWVPVVWSGKGKPPLGPGVIAAKVGTVKRPNGTTQLTYNKFPLYRYYLDKKVGQTNGEGVNNAAGTWYAISPAGKIVKARSGNTTTGSAGTTTHGATTTNGGYGY
jgi:predicted lipoprotein with Yx(FWY)xxD motif